MRKTPPSLLFAALALAGCGGSHGGGSGATAKKGGVALSIAWPAQPAQPHTVPTAANFVRVTIYDGATEVDHIDFLRSEVGGTGGVSTKVNANPLVVGKSYHLVADAYNSTSVATENPLAEGAVDATAKLAPTASDTVKLIMDLTLAKFKVDLTSSSGQTLTGQTIALDPADVTGQGGAATATVPETIASTDTVTLTATPASGKGDLVLYPAGEDLTGDVTVDPAQLTLKTIGNTTPSATTKLTTTVAIKDVFAKDDGSDANTTESVVFHYAQPDPSKSSPVDKTFTLRLKIHRPKVSALNAVTDFTRVDAIAANATQGLWGVINDGTDTKAVRFKPDADGLQKEGSALPTLATGTYRLGTWNGGVALAGSTDTTVKAIDVSTGDPGSDTADLGTGNAASFLSGSGPKLYAGSLKSSLLSVFAPTFSPSGGSAGFQSTVTLNTAAPTAFAVGRNGGTYYTVESDGSNDRAYRYQRDGSAPTLLGPTIVAKGVAVDSRFVWLVDATHIYVLDASGTTIKTIDASGVTLKGIAVDDGVGVVSYSTASSGAGVYTFSYG